MSRNKRWRDQRYINENSNICLLTFWLLLRKPSLKRVAIEQQSKIEGDLLTAKSSRNINSQSATRSQKWFVVSVTRNKVLEQSRNYTDTERNKIFSNYSF